MPAPPIPELGLAEAWEENRDLRRAAVKRGGLLDWGPNPKKMGFQAWRLCPTIHRPFRPQLICGVLVIQLRRHYPRM